VAQNLLTDWPETTQKNALKVVSLVGDKMKKFDAFLYLSSVSAGIGMIAANLLSVYDVSDYQPSMLSMPPAIVVSAPAAVVSAAASEVICKDCRRQSQDDPSLELEIATARSAGKVLSGKDLAAGATQVVPVSGLQR
jgi:hypothetical protein